MIADRIIDKLIIKNLRNRISILALLAVMLMNISCNEKEIASVPADQNSKGSHPKLILTTQGVKDIRTQLGTIPIFDKKIILVGTHIQGTSKIGLSFKKQVYYIKF